MRLQLIKLRDAIADSFWFVPALMALMAAAAALGSVAIDHAIGGGWVRDIGWVWSGGAEGARAVLSVVAGSVMTVVSIVFSLTLTTLAQTSAHFGSRILRNFTSDRTVQFTLGTFIATFVYCLLVLRTVRSTEASAFVPYLSVNVGMMLTLGSLAVLIYFIHHVSQLIQAENLIAEVGESFQHALPSLFPERLGTPQDAQRCLSQVPEEGSWERARAVESPANGYLQRIDDERLMKTATQNNLIVKLETRPGNFVMKGTPLLRVLSSGDIEEKVADSLCACFSLGVHRTPNQDALFTIQQLVEIAARALSPGINEPYAALACIDWLGASLRAVAARDFPDPLRQDKAGNLRAIVSPLDFAQVANAVFDQVRLYGAGNPDVAVRLLEIIAETASGLKRKGDKDVLTRHAQLVADAALKTADESGRQRIERSFLDTVKALNAASFGLDAE